MCIDVGCAIILSTLTRWLKHCLGLLPLLKSLRFYPIRICNTQQPEDTNSSGCRETQSLRAGTLRQSRLPVDSAVLIPIYSRDLSDTQHKLSRKPLRGIESGSIEKRRHGQGDPGGLDLSAFLKEKGFGSLSNLEVCPAKQSFDGLVLSKSRSKVLYLKPDPSSASAQVSTKTWHLHDAAPNPVHGSFDISLDRIPVRPALRKLVDLLRAEDAFVPIVVCDNGGEFLCISRALGRRR